MKSIFFKATKNLPNQARGDYFSPYSVFSNLHTNDKEPDNHMLVVSPYKFFHQGLNVGI
jgi:hypothetical protein